MLLHKGPTGYAVTGKDSHACLFYMVVLYTISWISESLVVGQLHVACQQYLVLLRHSMFLLLLQMQHK